MPEEDQPKSGSESPPKASAPTGVSPTSSGEDLAKGMAEVRSFLQRTGTALGTGATVLLTALGLTQAYELFPLPQNHSYFWNGVLLLGAIVGAAAALGGATWLASRFFWAQRRILLDSAGLREDNPDEKELVEAVLDEHAREQLAPSLLALELRALRFERMASRRSSESGEPDPLQREADHLFRVVDIALARAAAVLLERRARNVFRGRWTATALTLTVAGLLLLFAVSDYADGQRDLVDLRTTCSEAKPGAEACETVLPASAEDPATAQTDKEKREALRAARDVVNEYAPRGSASNRAAEAAKLVAACKTVATGESEDLSGAELTAAVELCVAAAEQPG